MLFEALGDMAVNKTNTNPHPHRICVLGERGGGKIALTSEFENVPVVSTSAERSCGKAVRTAPRSCEQPPGNSQQTNGDLSPTCHHKGMNSINSHRPLIRPQLTLLSLRRPGAEARATLGLDV